MSFTRASTFERIAPGRHRGDVDPAWAQGRGAVGGLVAAILVRALEADAPEGLGVTTLTLAFTAPATPGPATVETEVVRAGRTVATLRASLLRDGVICATALATLTRPRESALAHDGLVMPVVPPPGEVPDGPEPHYYPDFARRFCEFRQCLGPLPFGGGHEARVGGWCRMREPTPVDRALVSLMLDAWPPAAAALSPGWCPVASIELTAHFVALPDPRPDWLFFEATSRHVRGGLAEETATLWSPGGRALATARQLIAMFPPDPASTPQPRS